MPIDVQGPDGQKYQFPDGTDPAVMKQAMAKRYPKPQVNERDIPFADMAPKKPVDIMSAGLNSEQSPGLNDYLSETAQKRPDGGIRSAGDALLFNVGNIATFGQMRKAGNEAYAGTVNENYGDNALRTGNEQYPNASLIGRGMGFAYPAGGPSATVTKAAESLATKAGLAMTKGSGVGSRMTRYGTRSAIGSPVVAAEVGAFNALSEAPNQAFMEGRDVTVGEVVGEFGKAMVNPTNYLLGPGLSAGARLLKGAATGTATLKNVEESVFRGGGPVPKSGNIERSIGDVLDMDIAGGVDPAAFKLTERILKSSGLTPEDIVLVNKKAGEFVKAAPDGAAGRLTLGQVYSDVLYEIGKPQASANILKVMRERANTTKPKDSSPSIVGEAVKDLRGSQVGFLDDSFSANLGSGSRSATDDVLDATEQALSGEYKAIFAPGASIPPPGSLDDLATSMNFWRNDKEIMGDAAKIARRAGRDAGVPFEDALPYYMQKDPRQAAHWMQSAAGQLAREEKAKAAPSTGLINYYEGIVSELAGAVEKATPGYGQIRQNYAINEGLRTATGFGDRFIATARNPANRDTFIKEFEKLSPAEQDEALISIKNALRSPMQGSKPGSPARTSSIDNIGTLATLERLGPKGKAVADDIRAITDENAYLNAVDSGNPARQSATFSNADASANAPGLYNGAIANKLDGSSLPGSMMADMALSAVSGQPFGWITAGNVARQGIAGVFKPGTKDLEALTKFMMSRPSGGKGAVKPGAGIPTPPPAAPAANALATQPPPPAGPIRGAGWTGTRPRGFNDDLERGTDAFSDPRLNADQNKIAEMAKNGYSNAEIGEEMGKLPQTVAVRISQLRRKGIDIPAGRAIRPVTPERVQMEKLINEGLSNAQIAKRTGKSSAHVGVIRNRLKTTGPAHAGFEGAKSDLASGAVGSSYGYTQGDTPEEKNANAAMGFVSGIAAKRAGGAVVRRGSAMTNALAPKGPVRGAGFIGNTPKRGAKRLGRGLDDLTNEPGPAKPALPDDLPRRTVEPPAQGRPDPTLSRERTSKDDKAFYDSLSAPERDHARAVGPIGKMGKEPPPPGFVVTASLLTALGGAGGVSAYLGSRPVEPNFAQNRSKVMSELAKAPDSATWQNRARQFDAFVKSDTARQTDLEGVDKRLLNARRKAVREASDAFATAGDRAELTAAIDRVEALDYAIDVSLGNAEPFDEAPPMASPPSLKPVPNALAGPPPMTRNSQGQFVRPMTNRERQEAAR
jgi:biotin operon repressor